MFLSYTQPFPSKNVYHLVLIGEVGEGTIEFMVKTTVGGGLSAVGTVVYVKRYRE